MDNFTKILIAALAGITVLAFKAPDTYAKIVKTAFNGLLVLMALATMHDVGLLRAFKAAGPLIDDLNKGAELSHLQESMQFIDETSLFVFVAALVYLAGLQRLRTILTENKGQKKKR